MNDKESKQRIKELIEYFSNPELVKYWNSEIKDGNSIFTKRTDGIVINLQLTDPLTILKILKIIAENNLRMYENHYVIRNGYTNINSYSFCEQWE